MTMRTEPPRGILNPGLAHEQLAFRFFEPADDLAAVVERHWVVRWDLPEPFVQHVLPHPGANLCFEPTGASVHGIVTQRATHVLEGAGCTIGTMFRAGGFAGYSSMPMCELVDRGLPIRQVLGAEAEVLEGEVSAAADVEDAIIAVEAFLRARRPSDDPLASRIEGIVTWMLTAPVGTRVSDVASHHGLNTRGLQRLFRHHLGVGPKWVLQRYRLHEAAERIATRGFENWAEVALDLGYADQAHFIRDFGAVVGSSPQAYAATCRQRTGEATRNGQPARRR